MPHSCEIARTQALACLATVKYCGVFRVDGKGAVSLAGVLLEDLRLQLLLFVHLVCMCRNFSVECAGHGLPL